MSRLRVDVFLTPGNLTVQTRPANVKTILGSCVAICLWDPAQAIGGMNHFLLPTPGSPDQTDNRFGSIATPALIREMQRHGAHTTNLQAILVGGGHPVAALNGVTVGDDNVAVAETLLSQHGIPIVRRDTGGPHGRKLLFNTTSGQVIIRPLNGWPRERTGELAR